ncbi:hypothetical protein [Aureimonas leprariae]|uniref:hypothetical protein n=1 Tax=Plantimonas leprariae TaxID=2615207 RepID=UPI0013870F11|nr:hypothetical protein [Aureimonas leprariae]
MTMTPQEIDAFEFKQESSRALERALAYAAQKRAEDRARVLAFQPREPLKFIPRTERPANTLPPTGRQAFGRWQSTQAWADEFGVKLSTLRMRMGRGLTLEEALQFRRNETSDRPTTQRPERRPYGRRYDFNGCSLSITGWAAKVGIPARTIRGRLDRGYSIEDALNAELSGELNPKAAKLHTAFGQTMPIKEWAKLAGVSSRILHGRLDRGMTLEAAIGSAFAPTQAPGESRSSALGALTGESPSKQELPELGFFQ